MGEVLRADRRGPRVLVQVLARRDGRVLPFAAGAPGDLGRPRHSAGAGKTVGGTIARVGLKLYIWCKSSHGFLPAFHENH